MYRNQLWFRKYRKFWKKINLEQKLSVPGVKNLLNTLNSKDTPLWEAVWQWIRYLNWQSLKKTSPIKIKQDNNKYMFLAPTGALGMSLSVCLSVCLTQVCLSSSLWLSLSLCVSLWLSLTLSNSLCLSLSLSVSLWLRMMLRMTLRMMHAFCLFQSLSVSLSVSLYLSLSLSVSHCLSLLLSKS